MRLSIKLVITVSSIVFLSASTLSAQIVEDDASIVRLGGPERDYSLGITKTTSAGPGEEPGLFEFFIDDLGDGDSTNIEFQFNPAGIAEPFALFSSIPGERITPAYIESTAPFSTNFTTPFDAILSLKIGETVYFAYWDDRSLLGILGFEHPGSEIAGADDNYGWFELGRSDRLDSSFGQLEILGGATAIGRGIVVGTTNTIAIPEPSATLLIGLLSAFTVAGRRKR
jgi:hypothetical protein